MIERLQLITQDIPNISHVAQAENALKSGVKWIQLRMKNAKKEEVLETGKAIAELCVKHGAILILNDYVELVKEIAADGVHIGNTDMPVSRARVILGKDKIIGGTANTIDDVYDKHTYVDYIGLGPFRKTTTKKNLSPVLGVKGYKNILQELRNKNMETPVIGIGGVLAEDVSALIETGLHGVAVASAINKSDNTKETIHSFLEALNPIEPIAKSQKVSI